MAECVKTSLALFGGGVIFILILSAVLMLWEWLKGQINMAVYCYKRKHRFDNPPTAECYCKDCDRYEGDIDYCNKFSRYVKDCDFCNYAKPRKHDSDRKKNE